MVRLNPGSYAQTMAVTMAPTPNPNALKFNCGVPVGGPATYVRGSEPNEDFAAALLGIEGVTSIFMTADFVTVSKAPGADWAVIEPEALAILEAAFAE